MIGIRAIGDDAEGPQSGNLGSTLVGEHADRGAAHAVGPGEVHDLAKGRLTTGEATTIEVGAELFEIEGGAHECQGTAEQRSRKAIVGDRVDHGS